jgi:hypothetical protein
MAQFHLIEKFSPTIQGFILSEKAITILIAPLGEGKSFGCVGAMIIHAARCGHPIRCAIVRDTLENIKLSIVPTIQEFFQEFFPDIPPAKLYRFKNEYKELSIFFNPRIDVDLFGIDDPASLSKLQGSSAYSLIWLNEPAPISDKANAGLSEDVYNVAVIRALRRKGSPGRLVVDMNPADDEHWTYRRFIEEPDFEPEFPLVQKQVWQVPYGENRHLKDESRQAARKMYQNDPAAYARYVEGRFATIYRGKRVTPDYNPNIHLSPVPLAPAKGLVSFAYFDSWHSPAVVLGQITQTGRLVFLNTLRLEGGDIRALIQNQVLPMINSPAWKDKPFSWRVGGDFTMKQPDQSNIQESAARVVEAAFPGCIFQPGPSKWKHMVAGFGYALNHSILGLPAVYLCQTNRLLHKGLNGGWHYKTDNSGNVSRVENVKPEKDKASHFCDAWANAVCVLLPTQDRTVNLSAYRKVAQAAKRRIQSYAGRGAMG